jgi:hypothetical protein
MDPPLHITWNSYVFLSIHSAHMNVDKDHRRRMGIQQQTGGGKPLPLSFPSAIDLLLLKVKAEVKFILEKNREVPKEEYRYSSTLS